MSYYDSVQYLLPLLTGKQIELASFTKSRLQYSMQRKDRELWSLFAVICYGSYGSITNNIPGQLIRDWGSHALASVVAKYHWRL